MLTQPLQYSFQTPELLCFVMEYVNGGEVSAVMSQGTIDRLPYRLVTYKRSFSSHPFRPSGILPSSARSEVWRGARSILLR